MKLNYQINKKGKCVSLTINFIIKLKRIDKIVRVISKIENLEIF